MDVQTLQQMEALFIQSGAVKTRRHNLKFYPNTWTGKSFVDWLVSDQVGGFLILDLLRSTLLSSAARFFSNASFYIHPSSLRLKSTDSC
jgi:hypothetical protein